MHFLKFHNKNYQMRMNDFDEYLPGQLDVQQFQKFLSSGCITALIGHALLVDVKEAG